MALGSILLNMLADSALPKITFMALDLLFDVPPPIISGNATLDIQRQFFAVLTTLKNHTSTFDRRKKQRASGIIRAFSSQPTQLGRVESRSVQGLSKLLVKRKLWELIDSARMQERLSYLIVYIVGSCPQACVPDSEWCLPSFLPRRASTVLL